MPGRPAARKDDRVVAIDFHLIQPPGPSSPVLVPHPFLGTLDGALSRDVKIGGKPAATKDSTATNSPAHVPIGGSFVNPPKNRATIAAGSASVRINGRAAARLGDTAETCNDPKDLPVGVVIAATTVRIGG
jgi:uncharacterized Zn-binding protein involved in type VI secretion